MNEAIQHPGFPHRSAARKRARRERIIATIITAVCFVVIGFGIGIFATLYVTGFTW